MNIKFLGCCIPKLDCPSICYSRWGKCFILSNETTSFGRERPGVVRDNRLCQKRARVRNRARARQNVPDSFERGFRIEEAAGNLGFSEMPFRSRARARLTSTITNRPFQGPIKSTFLGGHPVADGQSRWILYSLSYQEKPMGKSC